MTNIADRFSQVTEQLRLAEQANSRQPNSVSLLAVSKRHSTTAVQSLAALGQQAFGESYLQEAIPKIEQCRELALNWHFIGHIQKNKTRDIARYFDWVHGIDRLIIAQRLSSQRSTTLEPLNLCIQINISNEPEKGGLKPEAAPLLALATAIKQLPQVKLRGLMGMAAGDTTTQERRLSFARLQDLFSELNRAGIGLDTLSMGMSGDFVDAISEGSTLVRIGTALFGPRNNPPAELIR